jgi:hypothetical protein
MIGALILVCCLFVVSQPIVNKLAAKNKKIQVNLIRNLFWYHMFFGLVYYTYTLFNRSDAIRYYQMASNHWGSWHDAFFTGTGFIEWLAYPWANFLFFIFEMSMVVFTWMGFWGFVCFYVFFKEQLRTTPRLFGYDLLTIILFLPNMHFWTASIGKGAVIFFGIGFGSRAVIFSALTADIFAGRGFGSILGYPTVAVGVGGALGSWLGGALHDWTGSYILSFGLSVLVLAVSDLCIWLAVVPRVAAYDQRLWRQKR